MLAQLRGRGGVPHGGLGLQEQGQLRALHQALLAGRPMHQPFEAATALGATTG